MGKTIRYILTKDAKPTKEQIAMIEVARELSDEYDPELPETDPVNTPSQYAALMEAVAERNRRIAGQKKEMA